MSGLRIEVRLDHDQALRGLEHLPGAVTAAVDAELGAIAQTGANLMKLRLAQNRSMARSTLANSIHAVKQGLMHWFVGPSVNYGRMVEEGTGPAAGRASYMPKVEHLEDYIRQRGGLRMQGKPGSTRRNRVLTEIRDRAWGLAMHIRRHGTRPHPFVAPTADRLRESVPTRVTAAVQRGLQQVFPA